MIIKKCKICGREFETRQSNYTLCSEECRKENRRKYGHDRWQCEELKEKNRIALRNKRWKKAKVVPCQICGENVPPMFTDDRMHRKHYHEDCIIREAIKAYKNGEKFDKSSKILTLAQNQGITKRDLLEVMSEDENNV